MNESTFFYFISTLTVTNVVLSGRCSIPGFCCLTDSLEFAVHFLSMSLTRWNFWVLIFFFWVPYSPESTVFVIISFSGHLDVWVSHPNHVSPVLCFREVLHRNNDDDHSLHFSHHLHYEHSFLWRRGQASPSLGQGAHHRLHVQNILRL